MARTSAFLLTGFVGLAVACGSSSSNIPAGDPAEGPDAAENVEDLTASKVTLRIPLLSGDGRPLARLNDKLAAEKLGSFPLTVEVEGDKTGSPLANTTKGWDDASRLVDEAIEKLKMDDLEMVQLGEPPDYQTSDPNTTICYKGNPKLVVSLIQNLTDGIFSDQLSLHGWRFRQTKVLADGLSEEDEVEFMPKIWREWRGNGNAILTISASSDGGEETHVGIIKRCQ